MSAQRLETETIVWLTTVRPDGRPHLVPIWFCWTAGRFWLCGDARSVKCRNIAGNAHVSVALESGSTPVVIEGRAIIHDRPYPPDVRDAFVAKFNWDIAVPDDDGPYDALIEIEPRRWLMGSPN